MDCDPIFIRTATMKRNPPLFVMIPGESDFNPTARQIVEELHDCGPIEPRSGLDRTAIAARSSRDRRVYVVEFPPVDQTAINEWPGPRSWPDRGPIMARSRPDRGPIAAQSWLDRGPIVARSRPDRAQSWPDRGYLEQIRSEIHDQFGSFESAPRNRSHDPAKPLPRPPLSSTISG